MNYFIIALSETCPLIKQGVDIKEFVCDLPNDAVLIAVRIRTGMVHLKFRTETSGIGYPDERETPVYQIQATTKYKLFLQINKIL